MKQILIQFRVLLLVVIPAVIFTGCQSDHLDDVGPIGNNKEVIFSINVPKSSAPSSYSLGDAEENEIATIEMLLFKAGKVAHNPVFANDITADIGDQSKKTFSVKLPKGTFDIMIFANSRKAFNSATIAMDDPQEATLAKLTVDLPTTGWIADENDANYCLIPMWGVRNNLTIGVGAAITGIYMHRMLSRIDLSVTGDDQATGAFKLLDINVYNPQTKGRIAPIMGNWDPNGEVNSTITGKATAPSLAVGAVAKTTPINYKSTISVDQKSNTREIYIFEATKATDHADLDAPYLTIKGEFDGVEGWYRIDLADYTNMSYLDVLRNSLYRVEIKKVTGTGFQNEEDAKKNRADNIIVNVTQWNDYDLGNTVFDGRYELLVSPTTIETNRLPLVTIATVATDYPEDPAIGVWNDVKGEVVLAGEWMSATITAAGTDANGRKLYNLKITILENATTSARTGYVHVKAGRLTNMVKVTQQEPKVRTIPTGGVLAEPNILAVNSKGELNLDGDGYIVYFRWGSMVALNSDVRTTTLPEAVAWVPQNYTTIHYGINTVAYQETGNFPAQNPATAMGDPCKLAKRNGVEGGYKMPSAIHLVDVGDPPVAFASYMGTIKDNFSGLMTVGGKKGYMYKGYTNGHDMQFYPFTGFRDPSFPTNIANNSNVAHYATVTTSSTDVLKCNIFYITEITISPESKNGQKNHAFPIRCVEDVAAITPAGGVRAQADILSVSSTGELNLNGEGEIVLFKWGSLVGLSGDPTVLTYPEAIAWLPPTYNGMGSSFEVIPFADRNVFPVANNLQTGIGDPCKEAAKTGKALGDYKMPAGNPYMGTASTDYGVWEADNGVYGRWYKKGEAGAFFYPTTGYRLASTPGIIDMATHAHYWSNTLVPGAAKSVYTMYFTNTAGKGAFPSHINDVTTLAFPIRCVPALP